MLAAADVVPPVPDPVARYRSVRERTVALCRTLTADDYTVQSEPEVSPPKWHLAHVTWFFETFLLRTYAAGYRPCDDHYEQLFNSYYNGVGMPFPRDKGYAYYESNHLPLAIMWKKEISKVGRRVDDYVSFIDLAPTILELAGVPWSRSGMAPITGLSIRNILEAATSGRIVAARDHVLIGKERNDVGRPNDQGYPIRGILKNGMLYLHNFESNRWPGGNPETGYLDTDGSPTKTEVLKTRFIPDARSFWELCFGKLPADQLFNLTKDPDCITNLAGELPIRELEEQLFAELKAQQDPRIVGGPAFDNFPDASGGRGFYERWLKGQNVSHDWIFDSDFQPAPTAANGRE